MTTNSQAATNRLLVAFAAGAIEPFVERVTGVKLTADQSVNLVLLAVAGFHAAAAVFVRYFPPPNSPGPTAPKAD